MTFIELIFAVFVSVFVATQHAGAWNIPTHMISGAIAYRILQAERPAAVSSVQQLLEKHPWYAERWRPELESLPEPEQGEMLFMLAARWADDIRMQDRAQHRGPWHYINFPFKPAGEPESIETKPPAPVNILTAMAENMRVVREKREPAQRAIALSWLFHLVGDIHQPLHTAALFTREYPDGDRGGNEICVRVAADRAPLDLHRLWDGLITSSNNLGRLRNIAAELRSKLPRSELKELASTEPEAWVQESFEIAKTIAYRGGELRGTPRGQRGDCRSVEQAAVLPESYPATAKRIADRRLMLSAYRLAALVLRGH